MDILKSKKSAKNQEFFLDKLNNQFQQSGKIILKNQAKSTINFYGNFEDDQIRKTQDQFGQKKSIIMINDEFFRKNLNRKVKLTISFNNPEKLTKSFNNPEESQINFSLKRKLSGKTNDQFFVKDSIARKNEFYFFG